MCVPDVMHVVAVKIHVAAAGRVLDVDAVGRTNAVEAWRGQGLMEEVTRVLVQPVPRLRADLALDSLGPPRRQVQIAFDPFERAIRHVATPPRRGRPRPDDA